MVKAEDRRIQRLGLVDERDESRLDKELHDVFGWTVDGAEVGYGGLVGEAQAV